jgi:hypothetical protein
MQVDSHQIKLPALNRDNVLELPSIGWQWKRDTSEVLNDFLQLAELATSLEKDNQDRVGLKVVEKTREFVLKWGPLWKCRTSGHSPFCYCYWTLPSIGWEQLAVPRRLCRWVSIEEVREFVDCAKEARAVLEVSRLLREDSEIPVALLETLLIDPQGVSPHTIKKRLEDMVNLYLVYMGGPTLSIVWNEDRHATMKLRTGLGFIHVVWMEIAQILCHGKGMSQCDGCGALYLREGRKPKAGQQNFCVECRENNKGAKRLSAQRRRERERVQNHM